MNLDDLFRGRSAIRVPRSSSHYARVNRLVSGGTLISPLPGVVVRAGTQEWGEVRAAAIHAYDPQAVFTREAASAFELAKGRWPPILTFVSPRQWRLGRPWFRAGRGTIPDRHVFRFPLPHTAPAWTVLEIATRTGSDIVDDALRKDLFNHDVLLATVEAMTHTPGNARRRRIVAQSIKHPWSSGERDLHALLRRARLSGWHGNLAVRAAGKRYFLDIAFRDEMVAVELDGWTHHSDSEAFEKDRRRRNDLTLAGWLVLNITTTMVRDDPDYVLRIIRQALEARRASRCA
ncbi:endonuclease domain-containing protein [Mariniluteicoccus flavus]